MEKLQPSRIDYEEIVLGEYLNEPKSLKSSPLLEEDFYIELNRNIFSYLLELIKSNSHYTILSVSKKFKASDLTRLASKITTKQNIKLYEQEIKDASVKRQIIVSAELISDLAYSDLDSVSVSTKFRQEALKINPVISSDEDEVVMLSEVSKRHSQKSTTDSFSTGYQIFDTALSGGFKLGDLTLISAQTGQGKTSLCQSLTYHLIKQGIPSLWLSYEVNARDLWQKFCNMGVKEDDIIYSPLKNTHGSVSWIETKIKEAKEKYWIKSVFIDHLGFLCPNLKNDISQNYSAYLGQICRELKTLAIQEDVMIFLPVHMRKTDNPSLNDIRDSSGIAQEADTVFILERQKSQDKSDMFYTNNTRITIEKNRKTGLSVSGWFVMDNDIFFQATNYVEIPVSKLSF